MKYLFPLIMLIVMLTILFTSNIYLSHKFAWIFSLESLNWLHILFAAISLYMIGGLIGLSNTTSIAGSMLYRTAAILTGLMLYLILSLLLVDLVNIFVKLNNISFGIIAFSLALFISVYGLWNATDTKITSLELPIKKLQQEVMVMHLSDIHLGHFRGRKYLQKLVDKTIERNPDFVVITGDLFDGRIKLNMENLEPLKAIHVPVYFVEGNHDGYSGVAQIKDYLRKTGVKVLENGISRQGELQIIGLNHMNADKGTPSVPPIRSSLSIESVLAGLDIDREMPSILLHHSPDGIKHAHAYGVDLYLAGHTHAGQLFPVNFINELLFSYNKGLHEYKGTRIFVSQGAGTFGPPMRVGTMSEITLIKLKPLEI